MALDEGESWYLESTRTSDAHTVLVSSWKVLNLMQSNFRVRCDVQNVSNERFS